MIYKNSEHKAACPTYTLNSFDSYLGEVKYSISPNDRLSVVSKFNLKYQIPYHHTRDLAYNRSIWRLSGNSTASYNFTQNLNLLGRVEYYTDMAKDNLSDPKSVFADGSKNVSASYQLRHFSLNPSLSLISSRYGYNGIGELERQDPACLLNAFVRYARPSWKDFAIGAGVYNMANRKYDYIQPYNSGLPPHPGESREFIV